jgi:hypothetical protein
MRALIPVLLVHTALMAPPAAAHGPQIQITNEGNTIITRRLIQDGPYSQSLTPQTSVFVIPILPFGGAWYVRPNDSIHPILGTPSYYSGPGFAYGYDLADGGPQQFAAGSSILLHLIGGLQQWNGAAFSSAGITQLKAFRGSDANISSPPEGFALTSELDPNLVVSTVADHYGPALEEVHSTVRYSLLGDGNSPTSASPNGVYLLSLQLSSTQSALAASEEFHFVLHKNASRAALVDAVSSLGFSDSQVQWIPEPSSFSLLAPAATGIFFAVRRRRPRRRDPR